MGNGVRGRKEGTDKGRGKEGRAGRGREKGWEGREMESRENVE